MKKHRKREIFSLLRELKIEAHETYLDAANENDDVGMHRAWQIDSQIGMIMSTLAETNESISESITILGAR